LIPQDALISLAIYRPDMAGDHINMKRKNIILAISTLALLAVVGGGIASASAATNSTTGKSGFHPFSFMNKKNLTDEEKAALDVKMKAAQEAQTAKQAAIEAAIDSGDYNAWVKAVGENCPLLKKVTADNFSKYVQAENLIKQAKEIYKEIGIDQGLGFAGDRGGVPSADASGPHGRGFNQGGAKN
jgi:hypothetical protein